MNKKQKDFFRRWSEFWLTLSDMPFHAGESIEGELVITIPKKQSKLAIVIDQDGEMMLSSSSRPFGDVRKGYRVFFETPCFVTIYLAIREPEFENHVFVPAHNALQEASGLLDLKENWDNEGSKPYKLATYLVMRYLVVRFTTLMHEAGKPLPVPRITPSSEGSIDVDWDTPKAGLLLNVKEAIPNILNGQISVSYFIEDKVTGKEKEDFFPDDWDFNDFDKFFDGVFGAEFKSIQF